MLTKSDLQAIKGLIKGEVDPLKEDMGQLKRDMKGVKSKLNRAVKDIKYMSGKFDEEIVYTRRRVEVIEKHLKIPSIEKPPVQN